MATSISTRATVPMTIAILACWAGAQRKMARGTSISAIADETRGMPMCSASHRSSAADSGSVWTSLTIAAESR
jgi:hypothetical protein